MPFLKYTGYVLKNGLCCCFVKIQNPMESDATKLRDTSFHVNQNRLIDRATPAYFLAGFSRRTFEGNLDGGPHGTIAADDLKLVAAFTQVGRQIDFNNAFT
jgi:hypothetical protein